MVHIAEDHLDLVMHCPARDTVHCTFVSPYANVIRDHFARKHVVDASNDAGKRFLWFTQTLILFPICWICQPDICHVHAYETFG